MVKFLRNSIKDISDVILLVAQKKNLPESIVEKDIWVSYVLDYLFNRCQYKNYFEFKGGTSLSKGFNLINRFSEDVDIVINSEILGLDIDSVLKLESRNQKQKKADELNNDALKFYESILVPLFQTDISSELNKNITVTLEKNELAIYINYPSAYKDQYINSSVKLEIGPLAAWTPNESRVIKSFAQEIYPTLFDKPEFPVLITLPKRTFWEKAVILHQEANRTAGTFPARYSRHYYDLCMMSGTNVKSEALNDLALLSEVREFTTSFYYRSWSQFENAVPGKFKMYPNEKYLPDLEKDYSLMRKMIYGNNVPSFSEILDAIKNLEDEINMIKTNTGIAK